jgi:hypothetical protein
MTNQTCLSGTGTSDVDNYRINIAYPISLTVSFYPPIGATIDVGAGIQSVHEGTGSVIL